MKVTAALSASPAAPFTLQELELDEPRSDEVLVKIHATKPVSYGLDIQVAGSDSAVLGHEGAGIVTAVGEAVSGISPGDHVVLSYRSCGGCRSCAAGERAYCSRSMRLNSAGVRADGSPTLSDNGTPVYGSFFGQSSFAQYALTGADNTVVVDPSIDLAVAAPLGCGFQTGAGAVLNVLSPEPDSRLVVFGAGGVGLAAVMAAKAQGVETIIAVDPWPRAARRRPNWAPRKPSTRRWRMSRRWHAVPPTPSTPPRTPESSPPRSAYYASAGFWFWSDWVHSPDPSISTI